MRCADGAAFGSEIDRILKLQSSANSDGYSVKYLSQKCKIQTFQ